MKGADLMKNKSVRIAGIILAVILGMAALLQANYRRIKEEVPAVVI